MSYRDDLEAAQHKIQSLQLQLSETQEKLQQSTALVRAEPQAMTKAEQDESRLFGGPLRLVRSCELQGEIPEERFAEMVDFLRAFVGHDAGQLSMLKGSWTWSSLPNHNGSTPVMSFSVITRDGRSRLTLEQKIGLTAGAIYGGIGAGVGISGLGPAIAMAANGFLPGLAIFPVWLGGVYWTCRKLFRSRSNYHEERLEQAFHQLRLIGER